jgi:hypothetical protein
MLGTFSSLIVIPCAWVPLADQAPARELVLGGVYGFGQLQFIRQHGSIQYT